jgi:hypothetical protein
MICKSSRRATLAGWLSACLQGVLVAGALSQAPGANADDLRKRSPAELMAPLRVRKEAERAETPNAAPAAPERLPTMPAIRPGGKPRVESGPESDHRPAQPPTPPTRLVEQGAAEEVIPVPGPLPTFPIGTAEVKPGATAIGAQQEDFSEPLTKNHFVMPHVTLPDSGPTTPEPVHVDYWSGDYGHETYCDECAMPWGRDYRFQTTPGTLLWEPPLANQRAPRMYGKFTTLNDESTIDAAIGGEFGLIRFGPPGRHEGFQVDGFAAVFTRFDDRRILVAADYRAGVPVTYARGPWSFKVSYEHTSSHLGDEFIEATGQRKFSYVRDEIVFGAARLFLDQFRLYGQYGYSFGASGVATLDRSRFDWGAEWSRRRCTGVKGQPFAAFDMDLREDQDYEANVTLQVGWQWKARPLGRSLRLALEYYDGKSPFGQFFRDNESWFGVGGFLDW